jgi:uncharacterized membrane protein
MPWWLWLTMLGALWLVPFVLLIAAIVGAIRDTRAERRAERGEFVATIGEQRGNPRGVGRHDWPL